LVERIYSGKPGGQVVVREGVDKRPLNPRIDLRKHSPAGFAWGEDSAAQAELALALLADALDNDERALWLHQDFNRRVLRLLPTRWTITRSRILAYVDMIESKHVSRERGLSVSGASKPLP